MDMHSECTSTLPVRIMINVICAWACHCVTPVAPPPWAPGIHSPGCSSLDMYFNNAAWPGDYTVISTTSSQHPGRPFTLCCCPRCNIASPVPCPLPPFVASSVPLSQGCPQLLLSLWWVAICFPLWLCSWVGRCSAVASNSSLLLLCSVSFLSFLSSSSPTFLSPTSVFSWLLNPCLSSEMSSSLSGLLFPLVPSLLPSSSDYS